MRLAPEFDALVAIAAEHGAKPSRAVPGQGPCRLWELTGKRHLWIKQFGSQRALVQERDALTTWGLQTHLGEEASVPSVVGEDEAATALLLTNVRGGVISDSSKPWAAAGAFLAALQALPVPTVDPIPLPAAMRQRFDSWSREAAPHLAWDVLLDARQAFDTEVFVGTKRVLAHRDFQPRNWLWDGRRLGVIDFEHARADHPLVDVVKLFDHVDEGDRRFVAFQQAWGRRFDEAERAQLRALRVLHGLACIGWGAREKDGDLVALGRRVLDSIV